MTGDELREIAHSGDQVIIRTKTDNDGNRNAAAIVSEYGEPLARGNILHSFSRRARSTGETLALNADLRKRENGGSRSWAAPGKRRMEGSENQHVPQLRQHRLGVVRLRHDAIVFDAPVGIHVSFYYHRSVAHIAKRRAKR